MIYSPAGTGNLLLDTNVLVLFVVGTVNRHRIETFKRTRQYRIQDFDLLSRVLVQWKHHCTVPHVLAEVSNLTDLGEAEGFHARRVLKEMISVLTEVAVPSAEAVLDPTFTALGLADASIATVARGHKCAVLTDDFELYLRLQRDGVTVINFTHLRARFLEA
jgi:hypothetical protein